MGNIAYLHPRPEHTITRNLGKWMNGFMIGTMILIINDLVGNLLAAKLWFFNFYYVRVTMTRF
jgi:hypothetical protein